MLERRLLFEIFEEKVPLIREIKWQIFEKALRFFTTICISILIANFLSTEDFGKYTYTVSILTIWIGASNLGMSNLKNIRQGKFFEIEIDETDQTIAKKKVEEMCQKLLVNLIIEDYKINILK